jgi:hypothetical protein
MSETLESEAIVEALAVIDQHLRELHQRELVSTAEVSDVLLDVRSLLAAAEQAVPSPN